VISGLERPGLKIENCKRGKHFFVTTKDDMGKDVLSAKNAKNAERI
jgi:hypothetical protein